MSDDSKSSEKQTEVTVEHTGDIKDFVTTLGHDVAETYKDMGKYVIDGVKGVGELATQLADTVVHTIHPISKDANEKDEKEITKDEEIKEDSEEKSDEK
jgi:uncharacterized protein YoxC